MGSLKSKEEKDKHSSIKRYLRAEYSDILRKASMGVIAISLIAGISAQKATAQSQYTAASCNQNDVNACINNGSGGNCSPNRHTAVDGDTIIIPPGTCTWVNGINIPSGIGISIIGSGTPNATPLTFGAGTSTTTIIDDYVNGSNLFYFSPNYGASISRVSLLNLSPANGLSTNSLSAPIGFRGTCTTNGCPDIRVDNLTFPYNPTWDELTQPSSTMVVTDNVFGVLDHNSMYDTGSIGSYEFVNLNYSSWLGVGQYGDNSWASADTFGTNRALYVENNYSEVKGLGLTLTETEGGFGIAAEGGGRIVCRFNSDVGSRTVCANHGTESNGRPRGGRQMEIYGNTMTCPSSAYAGCWDNGILQVGGVRSGTLLMFGNSVDSGFNQFGSAVEYRTLQNISSPWQGCDGTGPYDSNDPTTYFTGTISSVSGSYPYVITVSGSPSWTTNQWVSNGTPYNIHDITINNGSEIIANGPNTLSVYAWTSIPYTVGDSIEIKRAYICIDEPSRGGNGATLLSGLPPSPTGWVNEPSDPIYEAGDTSTHIPSFGPFTSGTARIMANRDYYAEVSQQAQTSPTSPFNGTSGTGYGTLANRPTTCTPEVGYLATDQGNWNQSGNGFGQGELFVCTSTNNWSLRYIPYTYPHPSTQQNQNNLPNPPTDLTATVK